MELTRRQLITLLGAAPATLLSGQGRADAEETPGNPAAMNLPAPEIVGDSWLNTGGKALHFYGEGGLVRAGNATVLHFWTFGCINCKHNQPSYSRWQKRFAG